MKLNFMIWILVFILSIASVPALIDRGFYGGGVIDCSNPDYTFCDDFEDNFFNVTLWETGACTINESDGGIDTGACSSVVSTLRPYTKYLKDDVNWTFEMKFGSVDCSDSSAYELTETTSDAAWNMNLFYDRNPYLFFDVSGGVCNSGENKTIIVSVDGVTGNYNATLIDGTTTVINMTGTEANLIRDLWVSVVAQKSGGKLFYIVAWEGGYLDSPYIDTTPPNITSMIPANNTAINHGCYNTTFVNYYAVIDGDYICNVTYSEAGSKLQFNSFAGNNGLGGVSAIYGGIYNWSLACWDAAGNLKNESATYSIDATCSPIVYSNNFPLNNSVLDGGCGNFSLVDFDIDISPNDLQCRFYNTTGETYDFDSNLSTNNITLANLTNGVYNWSLYCSSFLGTDLNSSYTFTVNNYCPPIVFKNTFETEICFLDKSLSYVVGYAFILIMLISIWLINTLLIRIPFFGLIIGIAIIFATLQFYACNTWIGVAGSVAGFIFMASDIIYIIFGNQMTGHNRY